MDNLSKKPCNCGGTLGEVIGHRERSTDGVQVPWRVCWYCPDCKAVEKAVGRETYIDTMFQK